MLTLEQLRKKLKGYKTCYIVEKTGLKRDIVQRLRNGTTKDPHYSTGLALHEFIEKEKGDVGAN